LLLIFLLSQPFSLLHTGTSHVLAVVGVTVVSGVPTFAAISTVAGILAAPWVPSFAGTLAVASDLTVEIALLLLSLWTLLMFLLPLASLLLLVYRLLQLFLQAVFLHGSLSLQQLWFKIVFFFFFHIPGFSMRISDYRSAPDP
jgi:hypothetical protein